MFKNTAGFWHNQSSTFSGNLGFTEYNATMDLIVMSLSDLVEKYRFLSIIANAYLVHERPGLLKIFVAFNPTAAHLEMEVSGFDSK